MQHIVRVLYPHDSTRRVWRGPLRGCRYIVRPGIGLTMAWGLDNMQLPFLASKTRPGQVIYDVGANCGQMALFFSRMTGPEGKVIAFEPVRENVEVARRNLEINAIHNVDMRELALAREAGEQEFLFDPDRHTMGVLASESVKMRDWDSTMKVRCDSIDHLVDSGLPAPDVLKIDVEGAAAEVLGGAGKLLSERPPSLFIELHALDHAAPELRLLDDLRDRFGYRVTDITGALSEPPGIDWGGSVWCDPPGKIET
ncbi:MAG: FkbM family methyltransferase [Verrucomicrobiaceae bacterium]|nr:FkbM family methyltransferase [Verrucomicrobiaceae bacterium]